MNLLATKEFTKLLIQRQRNTIGLSNCDAILATRADNIKNENLCGMDKEFQTCYEGTLFIEKTKLVTTLGRIIKSIPQQVSAPLRQHQSGRTAVGATEVQPDALGQMAKTQMQVTLVVNPAMDTLNDQLMKLPDANSVTRSLFSWPLDHLSSLDAISHPLDYSWSTRIASVAIRDCDRFVLLLRVILE
ncbi:hypothetical protein Tco_0504893 [Tanacetum coccineum]